MAPVGDVSFELERFEWTADDRLEVVGRWNGVSGRRMFRPALTVEAGGRRHRVTGNAATDGEPEAPWRATFEFSSGRGEIAGAELELGRSLVVELPPPRRRRRRRITAEGDLRVQLEALRDERDALRAELEALRAEPVVEVERLAAELEAARAERETGAPDERLAEAERLAAELEAARGEAEPASAEPSESDELAGLRLAHGSLRAAHEQLEDELEAMRAVRDERDELSGQLEQLRAAAGDHEQERTSLGELMRALQERTSAAESERDRLTRELEAEREEVARLERLVAERDVALRDAQSDATRRVETERAATTEVHARLATARDEAQRTIVTEAEETERLRAELDQAREDAERLLATERAEVARLREELVSPRDDDEDAEHDDASRRMLERVTRDLDRERAATRTLRRELEALRSESAEQRRADSSATANGTLANDDTLPASTRTVRTPLGTQRRVEAARSASASRVPHGGPSRISLWIARVLAALLVGALGYGIVMIAQALIH